MYRMLAAPGPLVLVGTARSHWPRWTMKPACGMSQSTAKAGWALELASPNRALGELLVSGLWDPSAWVLINLGWSLHLSKLWWSICKMRMTDCHVVMGVLVPCACHSMVQAKKGLQGGEISELIKNIPLHGERGKGKNRGERKGK